MSPFVQITAYSLLVGVVAAGFVWYGWALVDNIRVVKQNFTLRAAAADEPEPDAAKSDETASDATEATDIAEKI